MLKTRIIYKLVKKKSNNERKKKYGKQRKTKQHKIFPCINIIELAFRE